ncbi:hypothetical protein ZWY2020_060016 [Hordeum vulgare]|nr:hypothetical protein ZWY2020_060016 [Hordeum vulgare]
MEVIDVDSRSGGDTHIYINSDEEENAVYADDATSVAAVGNPSGTSDTIIEGAGESNGDDDAGGYSDGDDNYTEDRNDNVSSAFASKSQRGPYSYWHERDICRLVKTDGLLSGGLNDIIIPSSMLYVEFVKDNQPIYRGNLDSKTISEKRYKFKKKFFDYCKSEAGLNPGQEGPVYACCREAWPHIVEKARADVANE